MAMHRLRPMKDRTLAPLNHRIWCWVGVVMMHSHGGHHSVQFLWCRGRRRGVVRHSIVHPNSCGQSDWSRLTLLVVTGCLTLTQESRMGKWVKHPCHSHIWVLSQGGRVEPARISAGDCFGYNGASTGVVRLPNRTLIRSCPKLPPHTFSARSAFCTLLGTADLGEVGLALAKHSA